MDNAGPSSWIKYKILLGVVIYILSAALYAWLTPRLMGEPPNGPGEFGDMFGAFNAFFAGLAFIGVIYTIYLQSQQVQLQAHELKLQREELSETRKELSRSATAQEQTFKVLSAQLANTEKMAKHSALQIASGIMRSFEDSLPRSTLPKVTSIDQFTSEFVTGLQSWGTILESRNNDEVFKLYCAWQNYENLCNEFIFSYVSAVNAYAETANLIPPIPTENPMAYLSIERPHLRSIPHLQKYYPVAQGISIQMDYLQPGLVRVRCAGLSAIEKMFPGTVKKDALDKFKREVEALDLALKIRASQGKSKMANPDRKAS
jgi:hypothetical protein